MKKSLSLSTLALLLASPAFAGNISAPVMEEAPAVEIAPVAAAGAWTGGYVGGNINWGKGSLDAAGDLAGFLASVGFGNTLAEPDGVAGALRGGYDWQMGQGVFGVGAEYNFGEYEGGPKGILAEATSGQGTVTLDKMTTIFARAGYALNDQFMAYGLLGYSWAEGTASLGSDSASEDLDGMTVGLGGEYRFTQNWSAYGEIAYTDFGKVDSTEGLLEADLQQLKLGVNYRF